MNNPLSIKMNPGLYLASWLDDGLVVVEKLLNTTGKVLANRYVRHGAVTILREDITETACVLFVVEEVPSDVHISKESVIADLLDGMSVAESGYQQTLEDLKKAFLSIE